MKMAWFECVAIPTERSPISGDGVDMTVQLQGNVTPESLA